MLLKTMLSLVFLVNVYFVQVEKALRTVAKEQDEKEQKNTNRHSNLPEDKDAKTKENTQNKNNFKNNAALKGISQDLLNKVSAKPTTHHQKLIADCIDVSI